MSRNSELLKEAVRLLSESMDDYDNMTAGEFSGTSHYEPRMEFSREARAFLAKVKDEPQPDADGWIPWHGGECQVADDVKALIVRFRDGGEHRLAKYEKPSHYDWNDDGMDCAIIAYKIAPR